MTKFKIVSEYEWKPTFHSEVPAPVFAEHFDRLSKTYLGKVHPEDLVEYARPKSNAIHPIFEWDDKIGGQKYRIVQARQAMANLVIRVKLPDPKQQEPVRIRAIVNVREGSEQGYLSVINPLDEMEVERQILHSSLREAHHFARTYELLPQAKNQVESMRAYLEAHEEEAKAAGINLNPVESAPSVKTFRLGKGKLKVTTEVKPRHKRPVAASNLQKPQTGFEASA